MVNVSCLIKLDSILLGLELVVLDIEIDKNRCCSK